MPVAKGTLGALYHCTGRPNGSDSKVSPESSSRKYRSTHPPIGAESSHMAGLLTEMHGVIVGWSGSGQTLEQWFPNAVGHIASW